MSFRRHTKLLLLVCSLCCCSGAHDGQGSGDSLPELSLRVNATADPDTVLGPIRDLVVGPNGVWVAAAGTVPLAYYNSGLSGVKYPITSPTGPYSIRAALSLDVDEDGNALIWDGMSGRVLRVNPEGSVTSIVSGERWIQMLETPGSDYLGGKRNQVLALDMGILVGRMNRSSAGSGDFDRTAFVRLAGGGRDTVLQFVRGRTDLDSVMAGPRLFGPFPLAARCGRRSVAVYDPDLRRVTVYDSLWKVVRVIGVALIPVHQTLESAKELFIARAIVSANGALSVEEVRRHMEGVPASALRATASYIPAYAHLLCTPGGRILLERFKVGTAGIANVGEWEVYPPGAKGYRLMLPVGFRLFDATDELLAGVVFDSLDVPKVAVARWP